MGRNLLAALVTAGIVERAGGRRGSHLRVSPRFLAHAEGTAGRLRLQGDAEPLRILEEALGAWDEYRNERHAGALFLDRLLDERGQSGLLRPIFPDLRSFQMDVPVAA